MTIDRLAENRKSLLLFLNTEMDALNGILQMYVQRAGLAGNEDTTAELLNSMVVEALAHADRFDPARPPRAWLLGIAANLIRRRQVEQVHLNQREPLAGDLVEPEQACLDESELFDHLAAFSSPEFTGEIENREHLIHALALLSAGEQKVVKLFAQNNLNGDALAANLHMTPGAARVRLHRALAHLRRVWFFTEEKNTNG